MTDVGSMTSTGGQETCQTLAAAGLVVQASARKEIEGLNSLIPLIEAANSSGVRLLNDSTVGDLLAIAP